MVAIWSRAVLAVKGEITVRHHVLVNPICRNGDATDFTLGAASLLSFVLHSEYAILRPEIRDGANS